MLKVTYEMNNHLVEEVTYDEIPAATFQMHSSKALDSDGLNPFFYQKYWSLVRTDVCRVVQAFLRSEDMLWQVNSTHVMFIPKVSEPHDMTQLWPISLCNIIYRIGAKVVANRLKLVLKYVISDCQSAFVLGCLILNNTIIAFELAHALNRRRRMKKGFMALKLDMSKAYDLLYDLFLEQMLLKLGFHPRWVMMIMGCVRIVSYSFRFLTTSSSMLQPSSECDVPSTLPLIV